MVHSNFDENQKSRLGLNVQKFDRMTPLSQIQVTAVEGGNEEELEGGKGFVLDDMSFLRLVKEPLIIVFPVHFLVRKR